MTSIAALPSAHQPQLPVAADRPWSQGAVSRQLVDAVAGRVAADPSAAANVVRRWLDQP